MMSRSLMKAFILCALLSALAGCAPEAAAPATAAREAGVLTPQEWDGGRALAGRPPGLIRLSAGVFAVEEPVRLGDGVTLEGEGPGATTLVARGGLESVVTNADHEAGGSRVRVRGLSVDCGGEAATGVRLIRVADVEVSDLHVTGCRETGVRLSGQGRITRGAVLRDIVAERNGGDGVMVMWAMRGVLYDGVTARYNAGRGVVIDHSEGIASGVRANGNAGIGIYLRNFFANTLDGLVATRNGRHGIYAVGMVASTGSNWIASGNSASEPGAFDEIHFSAGSDLSYGVTDDARVEGVFAGAYENGTGEASARYGVFIAPGVTGLEISGLVERLVLQPEAAEPAAN